MFGWPWSEPYATRFGCSCSISRSPSDKPNWTTNQLIIVRVDCGVGSEREYSHKFYIMTAERTVTTDELFTKSLLITYFGGSLRWSNRNRHRFEDEITIVDNEQQRDKSHSDVIVDTWAGARSHVNTIHEVTRLLIVPMNWNSCRMTCGLITHTHTHPNLSRKICR